MNDITTYEDAMAAGRRSMQDRDWTNAYRFYGKAHGLGHDVLSRHLAAHRGLIRAAWRGGRPDRAVTNVFLLVLAWIFDRDAKPEPSTNGVAR